MAPKVRKKLSEKTRQKIRESCLKRWAAGEHQWQKNGNPGRKKLTRDPDEFFTVQPKRIWSVILKEMYLKHSGKEYTCTECGLGPSWNNRELILQLDHVNGNGADNRLQNLRWLCPNCHSQTTTFAGRNRNSTSP